MSAAGLREATYLQGLYGRPASPGYMRNEWQGREWRSLFVAGIDLASTVQQLNRWIHLNQSIIERIRSEQPSIHTESYRHALPSAKTN